MQKVMSASPPQATAGPPAEAWRLVAARRVQKKMSTSPLLAAAKPPAEVGRWMAGCRVQKVMSASPPRATAAPAAAREVPQSARVRPPPASCCPTPNRSRVPGGGPSADSDVHPAPQETLPGLQPKQCTSRRPGPANCRRRFPPALSEPLQGPPADAGRRAAARRVPSVMSASRAPCEAVRAAAGYAMRSLISIEHQGF